MKPLLLIFGCVAYLVAGYVWPDFFIVPLTALVMVMVVGTPVMLAVQIGSGGR